MYVTPSGDVEFGDVFSAEWLFDVHVRGDAVPLKPFDCPAGKRRPAVTGYAKAQPTSNRDLVLAHGQPRRAIVVSDSCEVESVLIRRRRGRLIFAAVDAWPGDAAEADKALTSGNFRRHPLPPADGFAGGVALFESLFAVGHDAVTASADHSRVARLDDDAVVDLEIRWNAYSTRRGPRTHADNARKLAVLLSADGDAAALDSLLDPESGVEPDSLDVAAANLVAQTLTAAWDIEGRVLNAMADALEARERAEQSRDELTARLTELENLARTAQEALTATKR